MSSLCRLQLTLSDSTFPPALRPIRPPLNLKSVGDQYPTYVIGTFGDGTTLDITGSTQTVFSSNNTQVPSW
ncbi:MAG TPA: hypothetical protein VGM18_11380 [Candidatus Sulfotelmatobacter sp.]